MLTIENFHKKLIGKGPRSKKWFCGGIEETATQYRIYPTTSEGKPLNRINIERNSIGEYDAALYELWFWSGSDKDPRHQTPVRRLLNKRDLSLGAETLITLIDYMMTLK